MAAEDDAPTHAQLCALTLDSTERAHLANLGKNIDDYTTLVIPAASAPKIVNRKGEDLVLQVEFLLPASALPQLGRPAILKRDGAPNEREQPIIGLPPVLRLTVRTDAISAAGQAEIAAMVQSTFPTIAIPKPPTLRAFLPDVSDT